MVALGIIGGLLVLIITVVFVWLYVLTTPKPMSLIDMNHKVRSLRKFYAGLSVGQKESYTGRQVNKSIRYLENKIREAQLHVS